jgi:hypothetical protein
MCKSVFAGWSLDSTVAIHVGSQCRILHRNQGSVHAMPFLLARDRIRINTLVLKPIQNRHSDCSVWITGCSCSDHPLGNSLQGALVNEDFKPRNLNDQQLKQK